MKVEIKSGRVIDPGSIVDEDFGILVSNGIVSRIERENSIPAGSDVEVIDARGKNVLAGLIDIHTNLREPGRENSRNYSIRNESFPDGWIHIGHSNGEHNPTHRFRLRCETRNNNSESGGGRACLSSRNCYKGKDGGELYEIYKMFYSGIEAISVMMQGLCGEFSNIRGC